MPYSLSNAFNPLAFYLPTKIYEKTKSEKRVSLQRDRNVTEVAKQKKGE
jgi:hypothetical protein